MSRHCRMLQKTIPIVAVPKKRCNMRYIVEVFSPAAKKLPQ